VTRKPQLRAPLRDLNEVPRPAEQDHVPGSRRRRVAARGRPLAHRRPDAHARPDQPARDPVPRHVPVASGRGLCPDPGERPGGPGVEGRVPVGAAAVRRGVLVGSPPSGGVHLRAARRGGRERVLGLPRPGRRRRAVPAVGVLRRGWRSLLRDRGAGSDCPGHHLPLRRGETKTARSLPVLGTFPLRPGPSGRPSSPVATGEACAPSGTSCHLSLRGRKRGQIPTGTCPGRRA